MLFVDIISHGMVTLLSGYLALSGFFATELGNGLAYIGVPVRVAAVVSKVPPPRVPIPETVAELPSHYETGGMIPRILLDNLEYQQAAVAGAGTGETAPISKEDLSIEDALANIFCTYHEGNHMRATSGSGVFIDAKGIILTNAHVAQFLLLGDGTEKARCVIRQGNPAETRYTADLLYISPMWIRENAKLIDDKAPVGTGERDYALLYVTGALRGTMPASFPALPYDTEFLQKDDSRTPIIAAGYPAEIFGSEGPRADLVPKVARTSITDLFTFGGGDADLMAIGSSSVGEQGSSGGPIVSEEKGVIGLIVTRGDTKKEGARSLRALTLAYIDVTLKEETGFGLRTTLEGNISRRADIFKKALAPFLSFTLRDELSSSTEAAAR